ncbi:DUF2391 family protein [Candidatus Woesearchaeota archaeon]|nr:DUF2391 family protein [Candidatus Woesearchaeota archaeon]
MPRLRINKEVIRVAGKLKEVVTVRDAEGHTLHKIISPLMVEFKIKDFLQVLVGASILAIPVGYTEETWNLGQTLPLANIIGFLVLSLIFIASFIYYNYYKEHIKEHWDEFIKRVLFTYCLSFLVVGMLLSLIQKAPWSTDFILAFKRTVIVTFPASMLASVADMIR